MNLPGTLLLGTCVLAACVTTEFRAMGRHTATPQPRALRWSGYSYSPRLPRKTLISSGRAEPRDGDHPEHCQVQGTIDGDRPGLWTDARRCDHREPQPDVCHSLDAAAAGELEWPLLFCRRRRHERQPGRCTRRRRARPRLRGGLAGLRAQQRRQRDARSRHRHVWVRPAGAKSISVIARTTW